jgi:hypothetical protein
MTDNNETKDYVLHMHQLLIGLSKSYSYYFTDNSSPVILQHLSLTDCF